MDFNNGLYVFNGVPGLEATKGERIAKALHKLQTKIKHLEQVRNSERETSSKSGSTDIEDITLSDVRLKLLFLQLQFMRVKLRKTRYGGEEGTVVRESGHRHEQSESEYCEIPDCCKGTQTGTSLHENISTMHKSPPSPIEKETHDFTSSQPTVPGKEMSTSTTSNFDGNSKGSEIPSESVPPSSKDALFHYHLNIDDVPFILGASAFESHNLIANVQNLLAKMKTHNKALCGSRFQAPPNCANAAVEKNCLHTKKIMKEISKDLTEIEMKQTKVLESFDNQIGNHHVTIQVQNNVPHESEDKQKQAKKTSNTTGVAAALCTKENKQMKSTRPIKKIKHAVPVNRIRPNLPQVARQRLLRSIKTFRTQLSEEDISWD